MTRSKLAKGLLAGLAATASLAAVPTIASAQAAPYYGAPYGGGYYDQCGRDTTQRSTVGGLSGAAIGATVGSGIAARGVRTEGAVLGGLLGAVLGANIGRQSAACSSGNYAQPPVAYDSRSPYQDYGYGPAYGQPAPYRQYGSVQQPYGYGAEQGYGYPVSDGPVSADGCTLAESPIYLPDGRVQKRFVRVCRDASGNYQVVD